MMTMLRCLAISRRFHQSTATTTSTSATIMRTTTHTRSSAISNNRMLLVFPLPPLPRKYFIIERQSFSSSSSSLISSSSFILEADNKLLPRKKEGGKSLSSSSRLVLLKQDEELWTLYQRPVGTLSPDEWLHLRLAFIQAGKRTSSMTTSIQKEDGGEKEKHTMMMINWMEHGFALLDRMAAERQAHHTNATTVSTASSMLSGSSEHYHNRPFHNHFQAEDFLLPVVDRPWVLFLWRNVMIMMEQQQQQLQHDTSVQIPTLPQVVDKLGTYMQLGLVPWTNESMTYLLDVMQKCNVAVHPAQAPKVAMEILQRLEQSAASAAAASAAAVDAETASAPPPPATTQLLFPRNAIVTTQLVHLWTKSRHPNAPLEAMKLLQESKETFRILSLQQQQQRRKLLQEEQQVLEVSDQPLVHHYDDYPSIHGDDNDNDHLDLYRPDAHLYASVMHAWAKSRLSTTQSQQQAVDLLLEAQRDYGIQPTTLLYNTVIHAITNQVGRRHHHHGTNNRERDLYLLQEATSILDGMIAKYRQQQQQLRHGQEENGDDKQQTMTGGGGDRVRDDAQVVVDVMPTSASYSSILAAYMRVGQLHKALALLHDMQDLARLDDNDDNDNTTRHEMAPSNYCFQTCLGPLQECIDEHNHNQRQRHHHHGADDDTQDFRQGAEYLQSLYRHESSSSMEKPNSVDMMQKILPTLDRMCLQVAMSPSLLDLHCDLLLHDDNEKVYIISSLVDLALQSWNNRQQQQQQQQHRNNRKERRGRQVNDHSGILKRFVHYQQVGLLHPTNATLNWMISSLSQTARENDASSSSSVALRAQEMIDMARQACRYNVHDALYHPNQIPMTRLAQLWAKTTTSITTPETNLESRVTGGQQQQQQQPSYYTAPHHKAEATLALLKDWYHETNQRMDMKPDVAIYNAVVRALVRHGPDKDQVAQHAMELLQECMNHYSSSDGQQQERSCDNKSHDHALEELYSSVLIALVQSSLVEQAHAFFLKLLGTYLLSSSSTGVTTTEKIAAARATIAAAAADLSMTSTAAMTEQPLLRPTSYLRPTPVMISSLVSAYTRQKRPDLADDFLRTMEKLYQETGDKAFLPNTICYNTLNIGYSTVRQPEKSEATLQRMLHMATTTTTSTTKADSATERANQGNMMMDPDVYSWNIMLGAWAKSESPEAAKRATAILQQLEQLRRKESSSSSSSGVTTTTGGGVAAPDVFSYNCVLECYWRNPQAHRYALAAEQLLESMETSDNVRPNANSYLLCLFVMRKAALGERSIAILERFCRLYFEGKIMPGEGPDTRHLNTVVGALGRTSSSDAFDKAVGVVKVMTDLHTQNQGLRAKPDRETFESLLQCALKSGKKDEIPQKAETVLGLMYQQWKKSEHDDSVKPDAEMYSNIISAWGNSKRQDAHRRLDVLLNQMQSAQIQSNRQCFANAMAAYRKHGRPEKVQAQFDAMVKAWRDDNSGGNGDGNNSSRRNSELSLRPNFPNYVTLLEAWADAGQAARANMILEQLLAENAAGRIKGLPNTKHFSSVIRAWTRSLRPNAAEQAEKLLDKMEHLSLPSTATSSSSTASKKKYPCRPDADTYASVIAAHAKSGKAGAAERADTLLKRLEVIYNETGDEKCRPNLAVYSEVLRAHVAVLVSVPSSTSNSTTLMRVKELLGDMRSLTDSSAWENQGKAVCAQMMESIRQSQIPERDQLVSDVEDIIRERLGPDH